MIETLHTVILSGLVAFILLPHVMCLWFAISYFLINFISYHINFKDDLKLFILSTLYPVSVPALSVYCSCREIFLGEDWSEDSDLWNLNLNAMKFMKIFEHIGEALPQLIMMSVFIANNGGPDEHPFGVVSAVFSCGSLMYGLYGSGKAWKEW